MRTIMRLTGLALASTLWSFPHTGYAGVETIVTQNDPAPTAGFVYSLFRRPVASDANGGTTVFVGRMKTTTKPSQTKTCLFSETDSGVGEALACVGSTSPDSRVFLDFGQPTTNAAGNIAWAAGTTGPSSGVYRRVGATSSTVALLGDLVPTDGNATGHFAILSLAAIADNGNVAFQSDISTNTSRTEGVFLCTAGDCHASPGGLSTVAVRNDFIPGQDPNERRFCEFLQVAASNSGVAFQAATRNNCSQTTGELLGVFYKPNGGDVEKVALQGQPANPFPGAPGGTNYGVMIGPIAVDNTGLVAFNARSTLPTLTTLNNVLFLCPDSCSHDDDPPTPPPLATGVLTTGQTDPDGNILLTLSAPGLDASGNIAFSARVKQAGKRPFNAVYKCASGGGGQCSTGGLITTLAKKGDTAPDTGGFTFRSVTIDPAPTMSSTGRVGFRGVIELGRPHRDGVFLFE
jgi:hypothetical protein